MVVAVVILVPDSTSVVVVLDVFAAAVVVLAECMTVLLVTIAFVEVTVALPVVLAGGAVVDRAASVENDSADSIVKSL